MAVQETPTSQKLRAQGNELYKSNRFEDAVVVYKRAADSAPQDPAPTSNLAAAYYELGLYDACVKACNSATALIAPDGEKEGQEAEAKLQKLFMRKAKAAVNAANLEHAQQALKELPDGDEKTAMERSVNHLRKAQARDAKLALTKLILELPRYKPMIRNVPEYFAFGHDTPESMYEINDKVLLTERKKISFLFGGVGDARNLHSTIEWIAMQDKCASDIKESGKCFHFTMVDHKPAVMARNILVFLMLDELSKSASMHDLTDDEMTAIICLYYTYLAPIMPEWVYYMLQTWITKAVSALDSQSEFPAFLDVPQPYRAGILGVLREWQSEAQEEYPTKRVRPEVIRLRLRERTQQMMRTGKPAWDIPKDCVKEEAFYHTTGVLCMDSGGKLMHGESLNAAYSEFDEKNPNAFKSELLEGLDATWRTNVTFIDLEWQRNREGWDGSAQTAASHMDVMVGHDPFELAIKRPEHGRGGTSGAGLFQRTLYSFHSIARAMKQLEGRYKVEACVGDVNSVLEQIRYGVVGHRPGQQENGAKKVATETSGPQDPHATNLSKYPVVYDRIHLSNVPDYVGGNLSSFLYALPATYTEQTSYVTSCCLRNPPLFGTPRHFSNEYIGLSNDADLERVFHAKMEPLDVPEDSRLVMTEYIQWHHCKTSTEFSALPPRLELEAWLYRIFLKLTIPKERKPREFLSISSPLNITAFIRLCAHLHCIGYPAHWIGGVLSSILSGKISCKARPPRSVPLEISEVKNEAKNKTIEQCTAPFVAELSTLLSVWQQAGILPFGIISAKIPDIELVHKYTVTFIDVPDFVAETPSFVLLLFDAGLLPTGSTSLRKYLLSDERADKSEHAKAIREGGLHVMSTWDWHRPSKTANFWLSRDVLKSLNDDWGLWIWRTDNWAPQGMPQRMKDVRDLGVWLED